MKYFNKTYEEIVQEENQLDKKYAEMSDICAQDGLSFIEFKQKVKPIKEELYYLNKYKRLKQTPIIEYGKEWKGILYTVEHFKNMVKNNKIIDNDGFGYYATENSKSNIYVYPSDITENIYRNDFTHILWIDNN